MELLGLSTALGAFIAGVMLADSPYRHELEADVEPFRSILLGLFFLAVGMMLDLHAIAERPLFVAGMALALIATKAAIIFAIGHGVQDDAGAARSRWGCCSARAASSASCCSRRRRTALLIAPEAASLFGAIVTLSMATTPFLMMVDPPLPRGADRSRDGTATGRRADGANALIVGYGRFGQTVGADADRAGHPGDADRHRYRDDRRRRRVRREGLLRRRHAARPAAPGGGGGGAS